MPLEERRAQMRQAEHNISMENRSRMNISGVEDVLSFTEETVVLATNMGSLTIKGSELRINRLNVESGELFVEGNIDACEYSDDEAGRKQGGFFARLFR